MPRFFNSATCCGKPPRTFAAMARPSMTESGWDKFTLAKALNNVGFQHLDVLDGNDGRIRPPRINAFFAGDNYPRINNLVQIHIGRRPIKEINVLLGIRIVKLEFRRVYKASVCSYYAFML